MKYTHLLKTSFLDGCCLGDTIDDHVSHDCGPTEFSEMDQPIYYPIFFRSLCLWISLKLLDAGILSSGILHHGAVLYQSEHTPRQIHLWNWVEAGIMAASLLCHVMGHGLAQSRNSRRQCPCLRRIPTFWKSNSMTPTHWFTEGKQL